MNNARVIKTAHEHEAALERIAELMEADPREGTSEAEELELLALVVDRYEEARFPIDPPDPIEAIRFRMDQMGLRNKGLGIPAEVLIRDPARLEAGREP
ncbi:MAG: hypothetical protein EA404_11755 [Spirochaetaceae bacterium]|nr:MAG: hypothetical protein EA404_11755 [Spirochaetaceae bacterium]